MENVLRYETKEESNQRRINETLHRTPEERLKFFCSYAMNFQCFTRQRRNKRTILC